MVLSGSILCYSVFHIILQQHDAEIPLEEDVEVLSPKQLVQKSTTMLQQAQSNCLERPSSD